MQIAKDAVVTLHFRMFDTDNQLLDETREPMDYLHGGYGNVPPKLEETLYGKQAGDQVEVVLQPEDAFGHYVDDLVRDEPRNLFPETLDVGMVFQAQDPQSGHTLLFRVVSLEGDRVQLDGNHPFAGMTIRFEAKVEGVRPASAEEIAHGHVHGEHGHHH